MKGFVRSRLGEAEGMLRLVEGSEVEAHHTQLALALLALPEGGGGRAALSRLVLTSAHLNTGFLLHRLQGSDLTYERAVLMGRAGNHQVLLLSSHHHISPLQCTVSLLTTLISSPTRRR